MEVPATSSSATEENCDSNQVSCFKNIPIRLYEGDKSMIQKLIKPTINVTSNSASQKVCMVKRGRASATVLPFFSYIEFVTF